MLQGMFLPFPGYPSAPVVVVGPGDVGRCRAGPPPLPVLPGPSPVGPGDRGQVKRDGLTHLRDLQAGGS